MTTKNLTPANDFRSLGSSRYDDIASYLATIIADCSIPIATVPELMTMLNAYANVTVAHIPPPNRTPAECIADVLADMIDEHNTLHPNDRVDPASYADPSFTTAIEFMRDRSFDLPSACELLAECIGLDIDAGNVPASLACVLATCRIVYNVPAEVTNFYD